METEVKLALHPEDCVKIAELACVNRFSKGVAQTRSFLNCYYDTPDGDLLRRRIWLRTRRINDAWLQTIKMAGHVVGGLHRRFEHEVSIKGPHPDPALVPDMKALAFLRKKSIWGALDVLIETEFERTARDLELDDGTCVEFVMDVGEIRAAGHTRAFCELELELVSGNTTSLMKLARTIADEIDVGLDSISKAHKGLLLIEDRAPAPVFADTQAGPRDASLIDLVQAGVLSCIAHIQGNVEPVIMSEDIEGVHQMRVGVRRLRAAMWAFKKALPGLNHPHFLDELKWLLSLLGPAREYNVLLSDWVTRLDGLPELPEGLSELRSVAGQREQDACAALQEALQSPRSRRLMLDMIVWGHEANWAGENDSKKVSKSGSAVTYAREQLRRGHRRIVCVRGRLEDLTDDELHALRIRIKRQRYTVEFVAALFKRSSAPYLKSLKRLQTALGIIQDARVVPQAVEELLGETAPMTPFMRGWCAHAGEDARRGLLRRWTTFEESPRFWKSPR